MIGKKPPPPPLSLSALFFGVHRHNRGGPPRPRSRAPPRLRSRSRPPPLTPLQLGSYAYQSGLPNPVGLERADLVTCSFLACQPNSLPPSRHPFLLSLHLQFRRPPAQIVMENRTHRPSGLYAFLCDEVQRETPLDRIGHSSTRSPPPPYCCCRFISNFDLPVRVVAACRVGLNGQ